MQIKKAYRFRLKTDKLLEEKLHLYAGHTRFLWNKLLFLNLDRLQSGHRILRYQEMDFWSKVWKSSDEYGFLKEAPAHILQQKMRDLDRAFGDAFDKNQSNKRLPKKRKRGLHDSFRFPEPKQILIEGNRVKLPKLGWIRFFKSRAILGTLKNATILKQAGRWYISFQVELEFEPKQIKGSSEIGLDMGIAFFAMPSKGKGIRPKSYFRHYEHMLAKAQRSLSRKKKYSKNWHKAKGKVSKVHSKIANARRDFLHWHSTKLSKNHAIIVVEDLKVSNMSKSAKGTLVQPGKNVQAKSGLNKSILDQGWSLFRGMLAYKMAWQGKTLISVPPQYTSQKCRKCWHQDKANRKSQAQFWCVQCGHTENADRHAAHNILAVGRTVAACGDIGGFSTQAQEPIAA